MFLTNSHFWWVLWFFFFNQVCWHFPGAARILAHLLWSDIVPLYSTMVLEDRMRKGGKKVGYGKGKKHFPPYATAVCFFFLSMQMYLQKGISKKSKPEMTDIQFYIHVKVSLIALPTRLPFGLEVCYRNFLLCTLYWAELVDCDHANLQTDKMSKHFVFLYFDQRIS